MGIPVHRQPHETEWSSRLRRNELNAIVFDFDGTLIESAELKTQAFAELFQAFPEHIEQIVELHLRHAGLSRYEKFRVIYRDVLRKPLSRQEEEQLGKSFRGLVAEQVAQCPLVPGVEDFLRSIAGRHACFIASGTPEVELRDLVERRRLTKFFTGVYGSPASKTEILEGIVRKQGVEAKQVLYIGDALTDHEAAEALGVHFIGRVPLAQRNCFPPRSTVAVIEDFVQLGREWPWLMARFEV